MRTRNHSIYIRMSDDEYALLREQIKLSGQTLQSYMINAAMTGHIASREEIDAWRLIARYLEDIDRQLRGLGTNCNQMAHVANMHGALPAEESLRCLSDKINQLRTEVKLIWQSTRRSISQQKLTEL